MPARVASVPKPSVSLNTFLIFASLTKRAIPVIAPNKVASVNDSGGDVFAFQLTALSYNVILALFLRPEEKVSFWIGRFIIPRKQYFPPLLLFNFSTGREKVRLQFLRLTLFVDKDKRDKTALDIVE